MSLNIVSFFRSAPRPRDWNNQELAEFYRVEASLIRSGLSVVTDRGLSDEGDPWFVFCRVDTEEVIVHFARIGGCYVVASPAFDDCVRGNEFRPLIERLIDSHPLVVPKSRDGNKVFIHPAALLVALVTTCFFKLGQSEASAAEIKGTKLTVSTSGSSDYNETVRGTSPVFLNDQAAHVALAIIASAALWPPPDVFSIGAMDLAVQTSALDAQQPVAQTADILSSPVEEAAGAHAHALNVSDPNESTVVSSDQVSTFAPLPSRAANADASVIQTVPEIDAAPAIIFQHDASAHEDRTAVQALNAKAQAELVLQETLALTHVSSADNEVVSILGDAIRAHLLYGQVSPEQTLIITSGQASPEQTLIVTSTGASSPTPTHPSLPSASADCESNASGAASTAGNIASKSEVDQAIQQFVGSHPDFLLFTVKNEVILFDSHLTAGNMSSAVHQEFSYVDGSTIFLIGLPASASSSFT